MTEAQPYQLHWRPEESWSSPTKRPILVATKGDLGADVIKIEPPGGEATRSVGPFLNDIPPSEREPVLLVLQHVETRHHLNLETQTDTSSSAALGLRNGRHSRNLPLGLFAFPGDRLRKP